jgi:NAD(P)-dependent dehydrogenase (short-subunit alcohol dehydrogenase family)
MQRVGGGHILNVSTEATLYPEAPYLGLYVATKTGLEMFSRVTFQELKPLGIRVTLIIPGTMRPREPGPVPRRTAEADPEHSAKVIEALEASGHLAMFRDGTPAYNEEVVEAMLYAISAPRNLGIDLIRIRPFPQ